MNDNTGITIRCNSHDEFCISDKDTSILGCDDSRRGQESSVAGLSVALGTGSCAGSSVSHDGVNRRSAGEEVYFGSVTHQQGTWEGPLKSINWIIPY